VSSPNPTIINQQFRYLVSVTNNGPATATGVYVTNVLPSSVTFISCSGNCSGPSGNVVICNIGTLASGEGLTLIITVQANAAGAITAFASVTGNELDLNLANNVASLKTTVLPEPGLVLAHKDLTNNDLVISWPAASTNFDFRIEATDSLSPPNWLPVSGLLTPSGGSITITFSPTNRARFFRLRKP
jgi:uncharacterized repeat protein (TIGR01451 family)